VDRVKTTNYTFVFLNPTWLLSIKLFFGMKKGITSWVGHIERSIFYTKLGDSFDKQLRQFSY